MLLVKGTEKVGTNAHKHLIFTIHLTPKLGAVASARSCFLVYLGMELAE